MNRLKNAGIAALTALTMANAAATTPLIQVMPAPLLIEEADPCDDMAMPEVRSFGNLPEEIQLLLRRRASEFVDIADAGEPFNPGDVMLKGLPSERFSLATVNAGCANVAIELGGFGLHFELYIYRRSQDGWYLFQRRSLERPPRSGMGLYNTSHALTGRIGILPLGWR